MTHSSKASIQHSDQLSPLMDDCLRAADMTLAQLNAMADAGSVGQAQKAYIEAVGDSIQLTLSYLDAMHRVAESLAKKLRQVQ